MTFHPRLVQCLTVLSLVTLSGCFSIGHDLPGIDQLESRQVDPLIFEKVWPGDTLSIRYLHTPELDSTVVVGPRGFVQLPLVGRLRAAGSIPSDLESEIEKQSEAELRNPKVTVTVTLFDGRWIHVGGEVSKPGKLILSSATTPLEAIFQAGGALESAQLNRVVLVRVFADGQRHMFKINMAETLQGNGDGGHIRLQPSDLIFVPRSGITNVNIWVDQYIRKNLPLSVSIRPDI
ncbi:MAG: hypothetical protein GY930_19155 [bacterium]|nr:hypothetical protein [bacterium]